MFVSHNLLSSAIEYTEISYEQYPLIIDIDNGVSSVTVKVNNVVIQPESNTSTYWIAKDMTASVSATYKNGYRASSGTGNYKISAPYAVNIASKPSLPELKLMDYCEYITKVITSEGTYNNPGTTVAMYCRPGTTVTIYHDSYRYWDYNHNGYQAHNLGRSSCCHFTVPSNASGDACLSMGHNFWDSNTSYDSLRLDASTGWLRGSAVTPILN